MVQSTGTTICPNRSQSLIAALEEKNLNYITDHMRFTLSLIIVTKTFVERVRIKGANGIPS